MNTDKMRMLALSCLGRDCLALAGRESYLSVAAPRNSMEDRDYLPALPLLLLPVFVGRRATPGRSGSRAITEGVAARRCRVRGGDDILREKNHGLSYLAIILGVTTRANEDWEEAGGRRTARASWQSATGWEMSVVVHFLAAG